MEDRMLLLVIFVLLMGIGALLIYYGLQGVNHRKMKVGSGRVGWELNGDKALVAGWICLAAGAGFFLFGVGGYRVVYMLWTRQIDTG